MGYKQCVKSFVSFSFASHKSKIDVPNRMCCSPNGWIDSELYLEYFRKDILQHILAKCGGQPVALFVDGQVTHLTLEMLELAKQHNIKIFAYPPYCTHALQGLDVVCFASFKDIYEEELALFKETHRRKVTKADFAKVFGRAFLRTFTEESIKTAFRVTHHPFDPSVITPEQMKPAAATAVDSSFPIPQPSPVKAIIKALRKNPPTELMWIRILTRQPVHLDRAAQLSSCR